MPQIVSIVLGIVCGHWWACIISMTHMVETNWVWIPRIHLHTWISIHMIHVFIRTYDLMYSSHEYIHLNTYTLMQVSWGHVCYDTRFKVTACKKFYNIARSLSRVAITFLKRFLPAIVTWAKLSNSRCHPAKIHSL